VARTLGRKKKEGMVPSRNTLRRLGEKGFGGGTGRGPKGIKKTNVSGEVAKKREIESGENDGPLKKQVWGRVSKETKGDTIA